ncbi:M24 family metallopeptidase [Candidatus Bipolaricaulota bacterium]
MNVHMERLHELRRRLADTRLVGCALLPGASFFYYTGIHTFVDLLTTVLFIPAEGVPGPNHPVLLLPDFEKDTIASQIPFEADYIAYERNASGYAVGFEKLAASCHLDGSRVGVESTVFRHREVVELNNAAPSVALESADSLLMEFRVRKSPEEVECIRRAAQLTEAALEAIAPQVIPGKTERELSKRFQVELLKAGADGVGFDCLVVSGPRAALQHAAPSDRQIQLGDTVLFDVGGTYRGYTADITRTFVVGRASEKIRSIYDVVREANQAAFSVVRPGILASDVDAASRLVIAKAGYGETFMHGTGHGLGLEVHEPPRIAPGSDVILQPGMVFTIEPGIYISGELGVRIEDDVVVTKEGVERLTGFDYELQITP